MGAITISLEGAERPNVQRARTCLDRIVKSVHGKRDSWQFHAAQRQWQCTLIVYKRDSIIGGNSPQRIPNVQITLHGYSHDIRDLMLGRLGRTLVIDKIDDDFQDEQDPQYWFCHLSLPVEQVSRWDSDRTVYLILSGHSSDLDRLTEQLSRIVPIVPQGLDGVSPLNSNHLYRRLCVLVPLVRPTSSAGQGPTWDSEIRHRLKLTIRGESHNVRALLSILKAQLPMVGHDNSPFMPQGWHVIKRYEIEPESAADRTHSIKRITIQNSQDARDGHNMFRPRIPTFEHTIELPSWTRLDARGV